MISLAMTPPPMMRGRLVDVAVVVVAGGDAHARAVHVDDRFVEQAEGAGEAVALEMAADLVVAVADAVGVRGAAAGEQEPGGLDGTARRRRRRRRARSASRPSARRAGRTPSTRPHRIDRRARSARHRSTSVGVAGGQGSGDHGVVRAVLGVGRAGEPDALATAHAAGPAVAGLGVDEQRHRTGRQAETRPHRRRSTADLGVRRQRGHRVAGRAVPLDAVGAGVAADPERVLGPRVVRFEVVVGDRPVGQRAPVGHAVGAGHAEVGGQEPPRHALVHAGAAADGHGVVVPTGVVGALDDLPAPVGSDQHPRVADQRRAGVVAVAPAPGGSGGGRGRRRDSAARRPGRPAAPGRRPRPGRTPPRRRRRRRRRRPRRSRPTMRSKAVVRQVGFDDGRAGGRASGRASKPIIRAPGARRRSRSTPRRPAGRGARGRASRGPRSSASSVGVVEFGDRPAVTPPGVVGRASADDAARPVAPAAPSTGRRRASRGVRTARPPTPPGSRRRG